MANNVCSLDSTRNWDSLNPEGQEALSELWEVLYHHYSLAEFYDDLEEHPWSSGYNFSDKFESIINYNGDKFENLYNEYSAWAQDVEGDVMKPKRPDVDWDDEREFGEDDA